MNMPLRQQELEANRDLAREQMQSNEEIARMQYGSNDDKDKYAMNMGMLQVVNQQIQALPFGSPQRRRLEQQRDQLMASMMSSGSGTGGSGTGGSGAPTTPSSSSTAFDSEELRYMSDEEFNQIFMTEAGNIGSALNDVTSQVADTGVDDYGGMFFSDADDESKDFIYELAKLYRSNVVNPDNSNLVREYLRRNTSGEMYNHIFGPGLGTIDRGEITEHHREIISAIMEGRAPNQESVNAVISDGADSWFGGFGEGLNPFD